MPNNVFRTIQSSQKTAANQKEVSKSVDNLARDLNLIQANIQTAFNSIQGNPFFGGNIIDLTFTANETKVIAHGLGRTPQYWLILDSISIPAGTYVTFTRGSWSPENIVITAASVACTAKLWVN